MPDNTINTDTNEKNIEQNITQEEQLDETSNMSFLQHIEELRKRIIISLIGVIIACGCVGYFVSDLINKVFLKPALDSGLELQNLMPFGQPFLYFKVILAAGLIVSAPFVLYQFWLFISPALYKNEKKWISRLTFFTSICFLAGVMFSYFILIPTMLGFAASFGSDIIANRIDINSYFGFISLILIVAGGVFELPVLSFVLTKMGLVNSKLLSKYRRHSIVIILIIAAILTPTPDPISQLIFAAPVFLLYELSILISWFVSNKNKKMK
jgi:sec-independent protein translocase protein TatC